jgi:transcriptional regulator with XRE-family HTH domain
MHLGVSQEELSEKAGISQTSISQIENGKKNPSKKNIQKICKVLKIPEAILYVLAIESSDVPKDRKQIFDDVYPDLMELMGKILGEHNSRFFQKK